jgi:3-deoxy-7-phosphoheptulonate synthase
VILRGGKAPNFSAESVETTCAALAAVGLPQRVMIDFSHANCDKQFKRQFEVAESVSAQIGSGDRRIFGVMIESNLLEGKQDLIPRKPLVFGQSITDACLGWDDSVTVLELLAKQVQQRKNAKAQGTVKAARS